MYTREIKKKAINLREKGKSYQEIQSKLNIPKSTLSTWLKNIKLSQAIALKRENLNKRKWAKNITAYNKERANRIRKQRINKIDKIAKKIPELNKSNLFYIGLGLFWGEGGHREKWNVRFANSDPEVIMVVMQFFRKFLQKDKRKYRFRIHLHNNIDGIEVLNFWANIVQFPKSQFYKPQIITGNSNNRRKQNQLPYGTLHIYTRFKSQNSTGRMAERNKK